MWRVLTDFADLTDGGRVYRAGENYPRSGDAEPGRAAELSGRNNKRGAPLIEWADDVPEDMPENVDKPRSRGRKKATLTVKTGG